MKKTFLLRVKKRIYFLYYMFKHMWSQLSNIFSKQYLLVYASIILSFCISYLFSLLSILSSIRITLILPIKSESLIITTIIIISLLLSITTHAIGLILVNLSKINIISVYKILAISKDFFTHVLLYFTLLLQFTDMLSFDDTSLLTQLEERQSWLLKCVGIGITALSLQIIYFLKYQLNDIEHEKQPYSSE
ncbi:hypothetical protein [Enterococcus faecium]|uniref:hypothetical protein n=1 Tax=Enterococcus faecium TaxID=1352 RepID=UPI001A930757|nr:hypothetical protein [Enterococcus faecium]